MEKNIKELYLKSIFDSFTYELPLIITKKIIDDAGHRLYMNLKADMQIELESTKEEVCCDYAYNLVLNRTYEGYRSEIDTIYGQLQSILSVAIEPASDEWDRTYNVDFCIKINKNYIGLQIKPIASGQALNQYQWIEMNRLNNQRFENRFGGKVFFIYSLTTTSKKKKIYNTEIIDELLVEINRLKKL